MRGARAAIRDRGVGLRALRRARCHLSQARWRCLCDDRVGRALDQLFDADRASLLTKLTLGAIREFGVDCSQLHNDSTSITLHGEYRQADGRERGGQPTAAAAARSQQGASRRSEAAAADPDRVGRRGGAARAPPRGRQRDRRSDAHRRRGTGCVALVGRHDFLYVADCKLCTREQMGHIDRHGGRFITVLPRSRAEDGRLREWMSTHDARLGRGRVGGPASARVIPIRSGGSARAVPDRRGIPHHVGALKRQDSAATRPPAPSGSSAPAAPSRAIRAPGRPARQDHHPRRRRGGRRRAADHKRRASAGSRSPSPRPSRSATAKRSAADPATTPATARSKRPASRSRCSVNAEQVRYDAASDGCFPLTHQRLEAHRHSRCSPPTATSPTSRSATTNSNPSRTPRP